MHNKAVAQGKLVVQAICASFTWYVVHRTALFIHACKGDSLTTVSLSPTSLASLETEARSHPCTLSTQTNRAVIHTSYTSSNQGANVHLLELSRLYFLLDKIQLCLKHEKTIDTLTFVSFVIHLDIWLIQHPMNSIYYEKRHYTH